MLSKAQILKKIDTAYSARAAGDKKAVAAIWAPRATFRVVAVLSALRNYSGGRKRPNTNVDALIDQFKFKKFKRMDVVVEGNSAAVHWQVTAITPTGKSAKTELYDLWKFNDAGKVTSMLQFADSGLLERMAR
jgi:ketosteroid isomerase-like protein